MTSLDGMAHVHGESCKKCEGCGLCLFEAGFKQDQEAAAQGYPFFFCLKCGANNFWD